MIYVFLAVTSSYMDKSSMQLLSAYNLLLLFSATVIDRSTYRFRVDNRYLFISRKNTTNNKQADSQSRRLYVSSNYYTHSEKVGFTEVQLPSLKNQQVFIRRTCT